VLERLQQNHLKLNLEKCIFGNKEVGLCNFFRTQIKDFAVIAAPLFRLTRKDSGYKGGPLPEAAMDAFINLRTQLISEPVMAFPRLDC